jgi:nitrogen fixation protein FixH
MTMPASTGRPITGRFVLIVLLCFFTVVITVNVVMMRLAIATLPGTEVDSAYSASLAYQGEIQAAHEQNARHWKVDAHIERQADGAAAVTFHVQDVNGAPLSGLVFSSQLERPIDRRADQAVDVVESGNGNYRGIARDVAPGQWDLVIEASRSGKRMFLSRNRVLLN